MADKKIHIFKITDQELLNSLKEIAADCNVPNNAPFAIRLGPSHQAIKIPLEEIDQNEIVNSILASDSSIINWVLNFPNINGTSITVTRGESSDLATINFPDNTPLQEITPLLVSSFKHLRAYERTESIDKLLGDELAEFYRRREHGLLRLENLTQKLIQQNEDYREKLDKEHLELTTRLRKELDVEKKGLEETFLKNEEKLQEREEKLQERISDLDDQDSRHARRQIRMDLKEALAERNINFSLTASTIKKRKPIHILFIFLIVITSVFFGKAFLDQIFVPQNTELWFIMLRFSLSTIALAATIIFYIRWNDQWFRQHADEEFKLKRLELDVDRASWVVEMAHEWKDEKGNEIPEFLIACLSKNLFDIENDSKRVRHPTDDLASALLEASSGLSMKIPGIGEASLSKRGVKQFKKAASQQDTNE